MAWLDLLAEREIGMMREPTPPPPASEPLIVLDESAFAAAVRDALRDYARPDILSHNPLTRSRFVVEQVGATAADVERVAALRAILKEAMDALQATPRDAKAYRALYHTYVQPAPSQEQAAEILDLPFSTFRRHLKSGVQRVTDKLWQREIGST
jgi:hypothetical protein